MSSNGDHYASGLLVMCVCSSTHAALHVSSQFMRARGAADLQNHRMATLIAINSKTLDDGQRSWNTYETELLGLVRMVQKH